MQAIIPVESYDASVDNFKNCKKCIRIRFYIKRRYGMKLEAIMHRCAGTECYAVSKDEICINLRTGKDVTAVNIIHGDPYTEGIAGNEAWSGTKSPMTLCCELRYANIWSCRLKPEYKRLQYYFEISAGAETVCMLEDDFYEKEKLQEPGRMYQYFKFAWLNPVDVIQVPSWVRDTVWYQIFPDRFCGSGSAKRKTLRKWADEDNMTWGDFYGGDLQGIISRLDYLKELGISGIYLTPILFSESNHKYDIDDYHRIDPDFGTEEDMKELVRKAHEKGIRIMLDAVFNHCGYHFAPWADVREKGRASRYADWFFVNEDHLNEKHGDTKDGRFYSFAFHAGMPKLNTGNEEVASFLTEVCRHWVSDWQIDGIRFDVGDEVSHTFVKHLRQELKALNPQLYLLGEIWHDSADWLRGDEYDSVMNYPFLDSLHNFWNDPESGVTELTEALNRVETLYPQQITENLFQFLDTHDTGRARSGCRDVDAFLQQLAVLCTMPGSVCLYYGTEIAMEGADGPYNRRCMPWAEIDSGKYDDMIAQVKCLISVRNKSVAARQGSLRWIHERDEDRRLLHYARRDEAGTGLEVWINAGKNSCKVRAEGKVLYTHAVEQSEILPGGILIVENI